MEQKMDCLFGDEFWGFVGFHIENKMKDAVQAITKTSTSPWRTLKAPLSILREPSKKD
jgi:hypothetical protein